MQKLVKSYADHFQFRMCFCVFQDLENDSDFPINVCKYEFAIVDAKGERVNIVTGKKREFQARDAVGDGFY